MGYIKPMKSIYLCLPVFLALILAVSCGSNPKAETPPESGAANQTEASFDPNMITQEHYDSTKEDVQQFIEQLNQIIRRRDYNGWRSSLSEEYLAGISSSENLRQLSEQPAMKTRHIVLKDAEDYFINVVVPSRANSRVDDIEFIGVNRVKAFTVNTNRAGEEVRLRLYDLEKTGDVWKIIN